VAARGEQRGRRKQSNTRTKYQAEPYTTPTTSVVNTDNHSPRATERVGRAGSAWSAQPVRWMASTTHSQSGAHLACLRRRVLCQVYGPVAIRPVAIRPRPSGNCSRLPRILKLLAGLQNHLLLRTRKVSNNTGKRERSQKKEHTSEHRAEMCGREKGGWEVCERKNGQSYRINILQRARSPQKVQQVCRQLLNVSEDGG